MRLKLRRRVRYDASFFDQDDLFIRSSGSSMSLDAVVALAKQQLGIVHEPCDCTRMPGEEPRVYTRARIWSGDTYIGMVPDDFA